MRKTELSHDDLKKKAVMEAERLAQSGGLAAISMRPVAKAAQCSPGTLYNVCLLYTSPSPRDRG